MNNLSTPSTFSPQAVERTLDRSLAQLLGHDTPALFAEALRHAVLAGGSRFRPRLLLAVAAASGVYDARFAESAAAAIELLHCASLVHDDLPAFDDAARRRGHPTVHRKYGEALAILVGDALIIGAYETLHAGAAGHPRGHEAMRILFRAGGAAEGLCKGQAFELAPTGSVDVTRYHHAKTGVLFEAAAALGALAANRAPAPWVSVGRELGLLYQAIDDLLDVCGDPERIGKDVGNDARHQRPTSAAPPESGARLVASTAREVLAERVAKVRAAVPAGATLLASYIDELLDEVAAKLGGGALTAREPHAAAVAP